MTAVEEVNSYKPEVQENRKKYSRNKQNDESTWTFFYFGEVARFGIIMKVTCQKKTSVASDYRTPGSGLVLCQTLLT